MELPIDYQKELKDFIKIISHDLRGPIRHIKSFHNILMDDIVLDEEQQELKGYMDDAIDHLENQLEGMLTLSRINTSELNITEIDIKILLEDISESLNEKINSSVFSISAPKELIVFTDRDRLYRACFEVIDNALKFHQAGIPAQVVIAAIIEGDNVKITISDQGIGIDDKYFQDIYQPFRCLNHQEDYPGSGMGLTLCQKALLGIKGSINVKKSAIQGCQFTITIPINANE